MILQKNVYSAQLIVELGCTPVLVPAPHNLCNSVAEEQHDVGDLNVRIYSRPHFLTQNVFPDPSTTKRNVHSRESDSLSEHQHGFSATLWNGSYA